MQTSVRLYTFLCVHTYVLTAATNRSRGIIAFALFGCPPKWCRKSILKIVLNWTIRRRPGADFTGAVCIVWHILLFFCIESILLRVCGRYAQEAIWRAIFLYVGLLFWRGKTCMTRICLHNFWKLCRSNIYCRHQRRMISVSEKGHGGITD